MQRHSAHSVGNINLGAVAGEPTRGGRKGKNKVLNWYRLPATGGWAPSARAVSLTLQLKCMFIRTRPRNVVYGL